MCGICGAIQLGGEPRQVLTPGALDRMTDVMTHRGPDDRGTYAARGVALGVRRLSIVDVEGGHQPFANEDQQIWAIQNGELYNHADLREQLRADGHRFQSRCDTEVIPHLYERFGPDFTDQLRGKFAIAVWDGRRRRAVLARDRLGVKPLYHARVGDLVLFASELKSLLATGLIPTDLDYEAIDAYLTLGFFPGPTTPLANVAKLLPGHRLVIDDNGVREEPYWRFPTPTPGPRRNVAFYAERLLAELEESVRLRLMSDVPLGAMLSGGLDSSLVVALMARNMSEPVKTFSVGFAEAGSGNELADARVVAEAFGTDHHELELSLNESRVELPDLVWHLDEPLADLSALGFLALCELATQHVTVALSGQGADELLGGYRRHRNASLARHWQRLPAPLRSVGLSTVQRGPGRLQRAARTLAADGPANRFVAVKTNLDAALRRELTRGPLADLPGDAALRAAQSRLNGLLDKPLPALLYLDGQLGLVDDMLHYFDRASMAHSLEVRVPFLDHHVVEYCATIPEQHKVRRLTTKYVLKHAARGLIPDAIIDKPKIGFFNAAVDSWFRAQASGSIADYLLAPRPRYEEFLNPSVVQRMVRNHAEGGGERRGDLLLSILMLEVWLSSYLPRALHPPAPARGRLPTPA